MKDLTNSYKTIIQDNKSKNDLIPDLKHYSIEFFNRYDSNETYDILNIEEPDSCPDLEISSLIEFLFMKNLLDDDNINQAVYVISFIVYRRPMSQFDDDHICEFFFISSEIISVLSYKTKMYLTELTSTLFLHFDLTDQQLLFDEYINFFNEIFLIQNRNS